MTSPLLMAFALWMQTAPPATFTADLDGQGAVQGAAAVARGKKVRLEIRDSRGRRLAESFVPAPGGRNPRLALTAGALGSAGSLLEVAAEAGGTECRSVWRYREGRLAEIPVLGSAGALPACGPPEWSARWERPSGEAPAVYVRERSRQKPNGLFRQVEVFRYAGFRLERDAERSSAWIDGVEIPAWRDVVLYRRAAVERLASRFDLSPFRSQPRLRVLADRSEGVFEIRIEERSSQRTLPVNASSPGPKKGEVVLTAGTQGVRVRLLLTAESSAVLEADVEGLGEGLDHAYVAVTQRRESGVRVYENAEQNLAEEFLPGNWDDGKDQLPVKLASSSPVLLRFGRSDVSLSIERAPPGTDVLLLPEDGALPSLGILLRGPDSFVEVPVRCEAEGLRCEVAGPGRTLRRMGSLLNIR